MDESELIRMKKIVFMLINMNIGGTEKALLNMIEEIPKEKYDITILMLEEYGGLLNDIPAYVNVEYIKGYHNIKKLYNDPPKLSLMRFIKKRSLMGISFFMSYTLSKLFNNRSIFLRYLLKDVCKLKTEYDIAVAYAGPMDFISYFVINKINAKKKFQWIHFDVTKIGFDAKFASRLYKKYDKIFVVSKEGRTKLLKEIPSIQRKTEVFLNIVSQRTIKRMSQEGKGFEDNFDGLRILTVGRLSHEKGQDIAIKAMSKLIEDGYKVKWYCLGEGPERSSYERLIEQYNLKEKFILLGEERNPYPFMNQCDVYVQTSRHEGYCITLSEAKVFNKPIISTNFVGAKEQLENRVNAIITNNENELFSTLKCVLSNTTQRNALGQQSECEDTGKISGVPL